MRYKCAEFDSCQKFPTRVEDLKMSARHQSSVLFTLKTTVISNKFGQRPTGLSVPAAVLVIE